MTKRAGFGPHVHRTGMPVLMSLPNKKGNPMAAPRTTSTVVLKALQAHRNVEVALDDLVSETGLTRQQVSNAVGHLRHNTDITSPRRGWYVYRGALSNGKHEPTIVPMKSKAEVTALLADGRVLVTIEGVLYVATELVVE